MEAEWAVSAADMAVTLLMVAVAVAATLLMAVDILASEPAAMVAAMVAVAAAVIPKAATAEVMEAVAVAVVMVEGAVMVVVVVAAAVMVVVVMVAVVTVVVVMVAVAVLVAVVTVVLLVVVTVVPVAAVMVLPTRAVTVAAQVHTAETAAPVTVVAETRDERQTRTTRARARPHMLPPELVVGRALMARQDPADQGAVLPEAGMALEVTPEDTAQAATQVAQAAVTPTDHSSRIEDCGETSRCVITTQTTILREHCNLYAFYCFGDTLFYGFYH